MHSVDLVGNDRSDKEIGAMRTDMSVVARPQKCYTFTGKAILSGLRRTKNMTEQLNAFDLEEQLQTARQRVAELERSLARTAAAEANWRALLTNAPDFVLIINPDGSIRYINRIAPGYEISEVLGSNAYEYVFPEYQESMRGYNDEILATGEVRHLEVPTKDPEGKTVWYSVRVGPFREDGEITAVTCIATDITQRRHAEQERQNVERRLNTLCTISPVGILQFDKKGRCIYINNRCCEITGRSTWELLGDGWSKAIDANDRQDVVNDWKAKSSGEEAHCKEYRVVRPDGTVRWVYSQTIAEKSIEGEIGGFVSTVTDITERKQSEEVQRAHERMLLNLLDLQEREKKLIAHDIHDGFVQDVVGAKMKIEGLCDSLPADDKKLAGIHDSLEILSRAITDARRMISELRPLIIDEQGVVSAINHLVYDKAFCKGLKVAFIHDVAFDRLDTMLEGTIFRIVQESINNIVRHSQSEIATVTLRQNDSTLQLDIQDDGVGFNPDEVADDRFGIRGIRERAKLFGGTAQILSSPGQGTQIVVDLPVLKTTAEN